MLANVGKTLAGNASTVGSIVGVAKNLGSSVLSMASNVVPMALQAVMQAAGGALGAIPYVGPFLSGAVNVAAPVVGMVVKGGLSAASGLLKTLPLEKIAETGAKVAGNAAQGLGDKMASGAAAAPSGGGAPSGPPAAGPLPLPGLPLPGGGGPVNPLDLIKAAGPSGLLALAFFTSYPGLGLIPGLLCAGFAAAKVVSTIQGGGASAPAGAGNGTAPSPGGASGAQAGGSSGSQFTDNDGIKYDAKNKDSENTFMQKLSHEQQQLSKLYEMCSNLMKSMHDTQMSSIRNMR